MVPARMEAVLEKAVATINILSIEHDPVPPSALGPVQGRISMSQDRVQCGFR